MRALVAALAGYPVVLGCPAVAQPTQITSQEAAQQLKAGRDKFDDTERRAQALRSDVAQINEERGKLTGQLQETARLIQKSEAQMSVIEGRRDDLEAQQKLLHGSLAQRHGSMAKLLLAMQSMGRNPPPAIITRREDALQMVRSALLLGRAFPELRAQADELTGRLGELMKVMSAIAVEREKLQSETLRLKEAQTRLASLMETKRHSLGERQRELQEVRMEADEIAKKVSSLSDLISALDETVAKRTELGRYEAEMAGETKLPPPPGTSDPAPGPDAGSKGTQVAVALGPAVTPPRMIEMAPAGGPFAGSPGRMKPAVAFHVAKAQLPLPAHGRRVLSFGETTSNGRKSQGIVIETRHSAQVTSPCDGWVVYAGEFRSYGQLLIINAGGGYHVLLAGLSHIDAQLGQFVLAAEPIGTMSAAPKGKAQDNAPVLYVEFRKEGRPLDPDPWWYEG
jgi:septal ring factor EnvC (AmiA/AmiB activator)